MRGELGSNLEALQKVRAHGSTSNTPESYLIWDMRCGSRQLDAPFSRVFLRD